MNPFHEQNFSKVSKLETPEHASEGENDKKTPTFLNSFLDIKVGNLGDTGASGLMGDIQTHGTDSNSLFVDDPPKLIDTENILLEETETLPGLAPPRDRKSKSCIKKPKKPKKKARTNKKKKKSQRDQLGNDFEGYTPTTTFTHLNPCLIPETHQLCKELSERMGNDEQGISNSEFVEIICERLGESNRQRTESHDSQRKFMNYKFVKLLKIIVKHVGKKIVLVLLKETATVQEGGGMKVKDKSEARNKTPGGVFIYLLKNSSSVSDEVKKQIFQEERKARRQEKALSKKLEGLALL
ncbi:unnamed protein product [Moneuplotes crassus]|uniref:Phosphorylated adapter RNA export protein n=1 Tax=Euplotes crassus TaxID=5936 RepID=A0AAD1US34_EUPCR|nr:unnamed protein product [Moneuplotes crassus]